MIVTDGLVDNRENITREPQLIMAKAKVARMMITRCTSSNTIMIIAAAVPKPSIKFKTVGASIDACHGILPGSYLSK